VGSVLSIYKGNGLCFENGSDSKKRLGKDISIIKEIILYCVKMATMSKRQGSLLHDAIKDGTKKRNKKWGRNLYLP
jgi:hypothetical protein